MSLVNLGTVIDRSFILSEMGIVVGFGTHIDHV